MTRAAPRTGEKYSEKTRAFQLRPEAFEAIAKETIMGRSRGGGLQVQSIARQGGGEDAVGASGAIDCTWERGKPSGVTCSSPIAIRRRHAGAAEFAQMRRQAMNEDSFDLGATRSRSRGWTVYCR
jgi:hypothetical protein